MGIIIGIAVIGLLVLATIGIRIFLDPFNFFEGFGIGVKVVIGVIILLVVAVVAGIVSVGDIPFLIVVPSLLIYPIVIGIMALFSFFSVEVAPRIDVIKDAAASIQKKNRSQAIDENTSLDTATEEVEFIYKGDKSITTFIVPDNVTIIGGDAFLKCTKLEAVIIPEGVREIRGNAFLYCKSLKSVELPSTVESIGAYAFSNCKSLTSIIIPASIKYIDRLAFVSTKKLSLECKQRIKQINKKVWY